MIESRLLCAAEAQAEKSQDAGGLHGGAAVQAHRVGGIEEDARREVEAQTALGAVIRGSAAAAHAQAVPAAKSERDRPTEHEVERGRNMDGAAGGRDIGDRAGAVGGGEGVLIVDPAQFEERGTAHGEAEEQAAAVADAALDGDGRCRGVGETVIPRGDDGQTHAGKRT